MIRQLRFYVVAISVILFFSTSFSQYPNEQRSLGPRICGVNIDFNYLDTVKLQFDVAIDSLVINPATGKTDTFKYGERYHELVFQLPDDSTFIYKEHIEDGVLINSKRNGYWNTSGYRFLTDNYVEQWHKIYLYFNDYLLFDASPPVNKGDLTLNYEENTASIDLPYQIDDDTINMNIFCFEDSLNDWYTCTLSADTLEISRVKSTYMEMELRFLYNGEYDRQIMPEKFYSQ